MLANEFRRGRVLCTQPRRLAVVAIATRVAEELGTELNGADVGYSIGQDTANSDAAGVEPRLHFVTAGYLLQRVKSEGANPFRGVSCIIIDEVHERSPENDLVLAFIKLLVPSQTKIVLMSASPNVDSMREYFTFPHERLSVVALAHSAAVFNVTERYLTQALAVIEVAEQRRADEGASRDQAGGAHLPASSQQVELLNEVSSLEVLQPVISRLVSTLWREQLDPGFAVLVFLPTWYTLEEQFKQLKAVLPPGSSIHVLHSHVDMDECMATLAAEESGEAKRVILASPIAESSVTINNVAHVVDCCRACEIYWSERAADHLSHIVWCSKSQAKQRRGRTGRTCHGTVWRLVDRETYHGFDDFETPTLCLQSQRKECLLLNCSAERKSQDAVTFLNGCVDPPPEQTVQRALEKLCQMKMLDMLAQQVRRGGARNRYTPTPYGDLAESLPIELPSAEFLIHSAVVGLLPEALVLASLSNTTPMPIVRRPNELSEYAAQMRRFGHSAIAANDSLLANFGAFQLWQRLLRDPQRWRRCMDLHALRLRPEFDANSESATKKELSVLEQDEEAAWCQKQRLSRSALWAVYRLCDGLIARLRRRNPPLYHRAIPTAPRPFAFDRGLDGEDLAQRFISVELEPKLSAMMRLLLPEAQVDKAAEEEAPAASATSPSPSRRRQGTACTFFLRGRCNRGDDCPFIHARDAEKPLCRYVNEPGGCRFGARCIFRHQALDAEASATALRASAQRALASLKVCEHVDEMGVVYGTGEEANCSPPMNYAAAFHGVLALDDLGFLCRQIDLASMRAAGASVVVATSGAAHENAPPTRGRTSWVQRDFFGVDPLLIHQPSCPLHATLTERMHAGTPVDCVLLRCPPTAEATEAFFRSMLVCITMLGLLAPNCQLHLIGKPEVIVNTQAAPAADAVFFCLTGVHAPPSGNQALDDDDEAQVRSTMVYVFSFDVQRASNAATVAAVLPVAPDSTVRAGWVALRLAAAGLQVDGETVVHLSRARVLAFDTEDAGSIGSVLQLGYVLADANANELSTHDALLRLPGGVAIAEAARAKHGIDAERLAQDGVDASEELDKLKLLFAAAKMCRVAIVAHNARTHVRQLLDTRAAHRARLMADISDPTPLIDESSVLCTMQRSAEFCNLHDQLGRRKMPSRLELFGKLHPDRAVPGPLNNALTDARMTMLSYIAGRENGIW